MSDVKSKHDMRKGSDRGSEEEVEEERWLRVHQHKRRI